MVEKDDLRNEQIAKRQKLEVPQGMSRNQYKKILKQKKWDEEKDEYRQKRRDKKKLARARKSERKVQGTEVENSYHQQTKRRIVDEQTPTNVRVVMDCDFDDLMNDKEIVSMSNQITRCYSAKRHSLYDVDLIISNFNNRLRNRFETSVSDYTKWQNMTFKENTSLEELLPEDKEERKKWVYLTADTEEELGDLNDGETYIIGGIVDKNRHKRLCLEKAQRLNLRVAKLPIGKFIQMNSRHVLATSHVYEIMCLLFENGHDWEKAFNQVLPPRKLRGSSQEPKPEVENENESEKHLGDTDSVNSAEASSEIKERSASEAPCAERL